MLVLGRKEGEEVIIGDTIRVVVHWVSGNRVAIGIVADPGVKIVRGELLSEFHREALLKQNPPTPAEPPGDRFSKAN